MKLYGLNINKKFSHERMNIKAILSKDESKQLIKKKTVNDLLSLYIAGDQPRLIQGIRRRDG